MDRITDIHMHIIPGVDDGSSSMEESLKEIRMSAVQGVGAIFATPHSWAIEDDPKKMLKRFQMLKDEVRLKQIPVRLYLGCEVLCYPYDIEETIGMLLNGTFPTMGDTRYVLTEFDPHSHKADGAFYCIDRLLEADYIPIIAHAERYGFMSVEAAGKMKAQGACIQINAYSVVNDPKERTRNLANAFLKERLADFVGTDAHSLSHRPPVLKEGIREIVNRYTLEYAEKILIYNPKELLMAAGSQAHGY